MDMREWINSAGKARGLTQRQVGADLGVKESLWSYLLSGKRQPDADLVERAKRYTDGAVTAEDWHRVRLAYLESQAGEGRAA